MIDLSMLVLWDVLRYSLVRMEVCKNIPMEIRIMHNLYQQVYKYSIPKNYVPLSICFISLMGLISIKADRKTKGRTYFTFIPLKGKFYQAEILR